MKNATLLLKVLFITTILFSSCTMEKRLYNNGYYVDWKTQNKSKHSKAANKNLEQLKLVDISKIDRIEPKTELIASSNNKELQIPESANKITNALPLEGKIFEKEFKNFSTTNASENVRLSNNKNVKQNLFNKIFEKKLKKLHANSNDKNTISALSILGIVFLFLGLFTIIFLSILIGGIILLGGLLMLLFGINKNRDGRSKNNNPNYNQQEVVYLKNGGRLIGIIIERIPGVSLKIQTVDGNIFPIKEEEIEKITKEILK